MIKAKVKGLLHQVKHLMIELSRTGAVIIGEFKLHQSICFLLTQELEEVKKHLFMN